MRVYHIVCFARSMSVFWKLDLMIVCCFILQFILRLCKFKTQVNSCTTIYGGIVKEIIFPKYLRTEDCTVPGNCDYLCTDRDAWYHVNLLRCHIYNWQLHLDIHFSLWIKRKGKKSNLEFGWIGRQYSV